tara:strand:+ start:10781 stop:11551 length:771 start_codon:yes stop_codon:yes gene_type:complete
MKKLDHIKKILIVSPSCNIRRFSKNFFEKKRREQFYIISWTGSIEYFKYINFKPDAWSFEDPKTWVRYTDFDTLSFVDNNVDLLILDQYKDNFKLFKKNHRAKFKPNKCFYSSTGRKVKISEVPVSFFYFYVFKNVFKKENSKLIYIEDVNTLKVQTCYDDIKNDWKEDLILYVRKDKLPVDKLSCFILPMVFNYFNNLELVECLEFWDWSSTRVNEDSKDGYSHYSYCVDIMIPEIIRIMNKYEVDIKFMNERTR